MATDLPIQSEMLAIAQQALRSKADPGATGAINLRPGSRLDLFQSCALALASRNTAHVADRVAARSRRSAKGDDLDIIAADIYNTSRKPANKSTGTVYLQRAGSTATVIPAGSRFAVPAAGSQQSVPFAATGDVPSSGTKVAVPVRCALDGVVGNVQLQNITSITDTLPDTGWALYVPAPGDPVLNGAAAADVIAGGDDGEDGDDDAFAARLALSSFDAAKTPGTYAGIKATVLAVPGISDATVISPGDGSIRIFCGDVNYLLSQALQAAVLAAVETIRAFGNPAFVLPYTVDYVTIVGNIYMNRAVRNYDASAISEQAVANVIDYFKRGRESPDSYFVDKISAAMEAAHDETQSVTLSQPGSDVPPGAPSTYAAASSITRYVTNSSYISIAVLDPRTS